MHGEAYAALMAISYAAMSMALKAFLLAGPGRGPAAVLALRFAASFALVATLLRARGLPFAPPGLARQMALRAGFSAVGSGGFAFSLQFLDVGAATVVNYTSSAWAGVFGLLAGDTWPLRQRAAAAVCLLGVAALARPGGDSGGGGLQSAAWGVVLGLAGAASTSGGSVHLRVLQRAGRSPDPAQAMLASFTGMLVFSSSVLASERVSGAPSSFPDGARDWLLVAAVTLSGIGGQLFSALAVRHTSAARVMLVGTLQVVFSFALQIAAGREPHGWELLGAAAVLAGVAAGASNASPVGQASRERRRGKADPEAGVVADSKTPAAFERPSEAGTFAGRLPDP